MNSKRSILVLVVAAVALAISSGGECLLPGKSGSVASVLKLEGVINDPIGAILAVLVFQGIRAEEIDRAIVGESARWGDRTCWMRHTSARC